MRVHIIKQQRAPRRILRPLIAMLMVFYLGYHALHGERGLFALWREQHELAQLQQEYQAAKQEREKLELRVSHLRDNSLDRDLLDEQMRKMMGVMRKDEVVILEDKK